MAVESPAEVRVELWKRNTPSLRLIADLSSIGVSEKGFVLNANPKRVVWLVNGRIESYAEFAKCIRGKKVSKT